jgi:hypothetical protein
MTPSVFAAMLITSPPAAAALLPVLAQRRPDLAWQSSPDVCGVVFALCGGGHALVAVDADHAVPGFEALLRHVYRTAPDTRLLVYARHPRHPQHAFMRACAWLRLVAADDLPDAVQVRP